MRRRPHSGSEPIIRTDANANADERRADPDIHRSGALVGDTETGCHPLVDTHDGGASGSPRKRGKLKAGSVLSISDTRGAGDRSGDDSEAPQSIETQRIAGLDGEGVGLRISDAQLLSANTLAELAEVNRLRSDFITAEGDAVRRMKSICRRYVGGDKDAGAALYTEAAKGIHPEMSALLAPMLESLAILHRRRIEYEKRIGVLAKQLPIYAWAKAVRGLGDVSIGQLVAEARDPGIYSTVSKLWVRMGVGIKCGGRQRKIAGEKAIEMGYSPRRRSVLYVVGDNLIRSRNVEYRAIYDARKAHTETTHPDWTKAHRHADAKRIMEKRLLRDLWIEWRRTLEAVSPISLVSSPLDSNGTREAPSLCDSQEGHGDPGAIA
jgi:hypothetical protein